MQLTQYAEEQGLGVYSRLARAAGVSLRTVLRYARDGMPARYEMAERLSAATGGACSIEEIRFPVDVGASPPRRTNFRVVTRKRTKRRKSAR